jgi:hypothetical protein
MGKTEKVLFLSALMLLGAGWFIYDLGSRLNVEIGDGEEMLWNQAPGDKWLYVGGLMMLIAGSLGAASFRLWRSAKREQQALQRNNRLS